MRQNTPALLRWFAVLWAGGAYLALLRLPMYGELRETVRSDGTRTVRTGHATLPAVNGPRIYLIILIPVLAALLTVLPWPARFRRGVDLVGGAIASAFVIL